MIKRQRVISSVSEWNAWDVNLRMPFFNNGFLILDVVKERTKMKAKDEVTKGSYAIFL